LLLLLPATPAQTLLLLLLRRRRRLEKGCGPTFRSLFAQHDDVDVAQRGEAPG
jgi:hypothetical protein